MPSLDFIARQMEWHKPKHTDLEAAIAAAVQEAVAKVLADHPMPTQETRPNPRMVNMLRPAVVMPPPAPQPVARKPPKPVPMEIFFEYGADGRIRSSSFVAPDGSRHSSQHIYDSAGRVEAFLLDDVTAAEMGTKGMRVRHDVYGRTAVLVPLEQAPPLRTADGQPILPAPINR